VLVSPSSLRAPQRGQPGLKDVDESTIHPVVASTAVVANVANDAVPANNTMGFSIDVHCTFEDIDCGA
jgi:hypothetical protein